MRCADTVARRHRLPQTHERNVVPLPPQPHLVVPHRASAAQPAGTPLAQEQAFVRRVYRLRVLGLGLGMFCIAPVLWLQGSGWWWLLLACNGLGWPHVARHLAQRSAVPRRAEQRNLMIDSALTGMWVAVIQFNLLPSVLLLAMLSAGKISAGGPRFFGRPLAGGRLTCWPPRRAEARLWESIPRVADRPSTETVQRA